MRVIRTAAVAAVLAGIVVVGPFASPVQLSYVYSDSMEPTIPEGSGYVLVPAGDVQPGDIVTFHSERRDQFVTHRVIAETPEGFVTKGDNNPSTDQASGLDPVARSQIRGKVLTVAGEPVTVPRTRWLATWMQTYWPILLGVAFGYAALGGSSGRPSPGHSTLRASDLFWPVFGGLVLLGLVFIVTSASHLDSVYVVTNGAPGANSLTVGENVTRNYSIGVSRTPLTQAVVTTEGMTIQNQSATPVSSSVQGLVTRERLNLTVGIQAPPTPGPKRTAVHVYSFPRTLPGGVTHSLARVHPVVAGLATLLAGLSPVLGAYWLLVDSRAPVRLPRPRWVRGLLEVER